MSVLPERRARTDKACRGRHAVYQHEGQVNCLKDRSVLLSQPIFPQAMNVLVVTVDAGLS